MEISKAKDDDALQPQPPKLYGINVMGLWIPGLVQRTGKRKNER
ncbi:MAG: hypothetical protein A4E31_01105 [Methanomassiliicoccales archaeon PtaU1.Bin030]|nr:MAG: hypothetical protein A4E31_01105 [Methanomassiliicoccales archaeon PtaU1.Bin030]